MRAVRYGHGDDASRKRGPRSSRHRIPTKHGDARRIVQCAGPRRTCLGGVLRARLRVGGTRSHAGGSGRQTATGSAASIRFARLEAVADCVRRPCVDGAGRNIRTSTNSVDLPASVFCRRSDSKPGTVWVCTRLETRAGPDVDRVRSLSRCSPCDVNDLRRRCDRNSFGWIGGRSSRT